MKSVFSFAPKLGVPTKTQNHDQKKFFVREIFQNVEVTRTVPFECRQWK